MNIKKAMHSLTKTARKVRKVRLEGHKRVLRKKRANVKRRAGKLASGTRKARTKRQQVAALRTELLAAYRTTAANYRKVGQATAAALKKLHPQAEALEKLASRYAELSDKTDHSPSAENAVICAESVAESFRDLVSDFDMALVATRDEL